MARDGRAEVAGHFGELIQGRLGPSGPVALVTLPCPALRVRARLRPGPALALRDGGARLMPRRHAAALLRASGPGRLRLVADMPAGGGAGASTAARLAVLRAAARAAGRPAPSPVAEARLCLAQEGATDPLMHPDPAARLWAPREARTLRALPPPPPLVAVGGFFGPPRATDPADLRFADIADLAEAWPEAAARGDLPGLAALATESARRNAALRGFAALPALLAAARAHGALGVAAAHTGSAAALIFAPDGGDPRAAAAALAGLGASGPLRFALGGAA